MRATLSWRSPSDVPDEPLFADLAAPDARLEVTEAAVAETARRQLVVGVRALTRREMGAALEAVMRAVTEVASVEDAVLEACAERISPCRVADPHSALALAFWVREAGFPARFGASWTPAPEAEAFLGTGGEDRLAALVRGHAAWETCG